VTRVIYEVEHRIAAERWGEPWTQVLSAADERHVGCHDGHELDIRPQRQGWPCKAPLRRRALRPSLVLRLPPRSAAEIRWGFPRHVPSVADINLTAGNVVDPASSEMDLVSPVIACLVAVYGADTPGEHARRSSHC